MSISANLVKELREKTSAGMMDCKKALEETKGDFEAAVEWLRKKGLSSAAKKSGRVAAEGAVFAQSNGKTGVLVEINSETDFVARNDGFKTFVTTIAEHVMTAPTGDIMTQKIAKTGKSVEDSLKEVIATLGENVVVRRTLKYEATGNGLVHTYVHGEGKIGVIVEVTGANTADVKTFAQDVCLHIAAMNPMAISGDQMPADVIAKEKEILKAKNLEQGKKAEMVDKIVEGQIKKFLAESCLMDQPFVKNPDLKVSDYMKETGKKAGAELKIARFTRFELGEGIEKKTTDFAAEVAAQTKGH
jgi:elongation factor Ts